MKASPGERVMDSRTGKVICRVKNEIVPFSPARASDFHEFAPDETPWVAYGKIDRRCIKPKPGGGAMLFIEGEWRA